MSFFQYAHYYNFMSVKQIPIHTNVNLKIKQKYDICHISNAARFIILVTSNRFAKN